MALIVETGTGAANSESYISVAECNTYLASLGFTIWAPLLEEEKEQALRRAMEYMTQQYRLRWKGYRTSSTQALDWPRSYVQIPDAALYSWSYVGSTEIPTTLKRAQAKLALRAAAGELTPDITRAVVSETIGPIRTVYDTSAKQSPQYLEIDNMLAIYLGSSANGASVKLHRT